MRRIKFNIKPTFKNGGFKGMRNSGFRISNTTPFFIKVPNFNKFLKFFKNKSNKNLVTGKTDFLGSFSSSKFKNTNNFCVIDDLDNIF